MLRQFGRWAEFVRAKVVNLNPESALECFEKADRDEVLGTRAPWRKPACPQRGEPGLDGHQRVAHS
jgi:hypothetical protein